MLNRLLEYSPETEMFEAETLEGATDADAGVLQETEEIGLTLEFLTVRSERGFNRFLAKLIRCVSRRSARALDPQMFSAISNILNRAGEAIFRIAGGARDTSIGQRLAAEASRLFGLELEELSNEDREFETARRCVRFLSEAVTNVAMVEAGNPLLAAREATAAAAKKYAPGLFNLLSIYWRGPSSSAKTGPWLRKGRNIVAINC